MPPNFINRPHERELWREPWKLDPRSSKHRDFKAKLWEHGYLSPHFTRREAGGQDRHVNGCAVPESLRHKAQFHAFVLERVRHDLGDRPLSPISWYRCRAHNDAVGGVYNSQHLNAWATDWSDAVRSSFGGARFDAAMKNRFSRGGIGYLDLGNRAHVRHVDNGPQRVWDY